MYDFTRQFALNVNMTTFSKATEYLSPMDGNTYVEGRKGSEYKLHLVNDSNEEVLMVPSVDGLSVIDGKEAGLQSQGYVLRPRSDLLIPGWTYNNNQAAKFVFEDAKSSYVSRTGNNQQNIGAIGLMVFRPKERMVHAFDSSSLGGSPRGMVKGMGGGHDSYTATSATASDWDVQTESSVGTGYGDAVDFATTQTTFERRDPTNPDAIIAIYYDTAKGLEKKGIRLDYRSNKSPDPFPRYANTGAKPPPGWRP